MVDANKNRDVDSHILESKILGCISDAERPPYDNVAKALTLFSPINSGTADCNPSVLADVRPTSRTAEPTAVEKGLPPNVLKKIAVSRT